MLWSVEAFWEEAIQHVCMLCPDPWRLWHYYGRELGWMRLLAVQILFCLPKLLIVMRVEVLKEKLLTISRHWRYPVSHFLILVKLVRSPRSLGSLEKVVSFSNWWWKLCSWWAMGDYGVMLLFSSLTPTAIDYNPNVSATMQQPSSVEHLKTREITAFGKRSFWDTLFHNAKKTITPLYNGLVYIFT